FGGPSLRLPSPTSSAYGERSEQNSCSAIGGSFLHALNTGLKRHLVYNFSEIVWLRGHALGAFAPVETVSDKGTLFETY
ncbi:hypothetical protein J6590_033529, partial [Homalodisca vitripennis]